MAVQWHASLMRKGEGQRYSQLSTVLSLVFVAGVLHSLQLGSLALLVCHCASPVLPVGVLLSSDLPLPRFSLSQLCSAEQSATLSLCRSFHVILWAKRLSRAPTFHCACDTRLASRLISPVQPCQVSEIEGFQICQRKHDMLAHRDQTTQALFKCNS